MANDAESLGAFCQDLSHWIELGMIQNVAGENSYGEIIRRAQVARGTLRPIQPNHPFLAIYGDALSLLKRSYSGIGSLHCLISEAPSTKRVDPFHTR